MNTDQQKEHFEVQVKAMAETMLSKGNDYATEDRLKIFKDVAAIVGITPQQVSMVMIALKVARMANLHKQGTKPEHESLADSSLDLMCYSVLNDAMFKDL